MTERCLFPLGHVIYVLLGEYIHSLVRHTCLHNSRTQNLILSGLKLWVRTVNDISRLVREYRSQIDRHVFTLIILDGVSQQNSSFTLLHPFRKLPHEPYIKSHILDLIFNLFLIKIIDLSKVFGFFLSHNFLSPNF